MLALAVITRRTAAPAAAPAPTGQSRRVDGVRVARDGAALAEQVRKNAGRRAGGDAVADHALKGVCRSIPAALGPFVYRAAPWAAEDQRQYFTLLRHPRAGSALLHDRPPAAILTGMEGDIDSAFDAFTRQQGYPMTRITLKQTRRRGQRPTVSGSSTKPARVRGAARRFRRVP